MDMPSGTIPPADDLYILHGPGSLADKLESVHRIVCRYLAFVDRIAVALYDADTDLVKTFLGSDADGPATVVGYQRRLADSPSLTAIALERRPRVIDDLETVDSEGAAHRALTARGYRASYTMPMYGRGELAGFIFFNSARAQAFTPSARGYLDMVGHLLALTVVGELVQIRTLSASVRTATEFVRSRDFETGAHLERMAHYSRLIAQTVAPRHGLGDEFVERIFLFSPLHDIGKIAVADAVLLKPGKLSPDELASMKTHTIKGGEIIDTMLAHFGMASMPDATLLRNIALYHHEALDGSGYPHGVANGGIPLEARITAVADIFDALTSARPYKHAWSNEEAFAELIGLSGRRLDPECVDALVLQPERVEEIQARFAENATG